MIHGTFQPFDLHKGRPCWVLGGGPSLLEQDPAEVTGTHLKHGIIIGVNHHGVLLADHGYGYPDYWVGLDLGLVDLHPELFFPGPRCPGAIKLFPRLVGTRLECGGYQYGGDGRGMNWLEIEAHHNLTPERWTRVLGSAISTVGAGLHLAVIMGCDPIHVRGLDLKRDSEGRINWYDYPHPEKANATDDEYAGQADDLHCLIQHFIKQGVRIDVRGAGWLTERPYVPVWRRPPDGRIKSLGAVALKGVEA